MKHVTRMNFEGILVTDSSEGTFINLVGKNHSRETWSHIATLAQFPEEAYSEAIEQSVRHIAARMRLDLIERA